MGFLSIPDIEILITKTIERIFVLINYRLFNFDKFQAFKFIFLGKTRK